jgi:signal transduction histidine kinase
LRSPGRDGSVDALGRLGRIVDGDRGKHHLQRGHEEAERALALGGEFLATLRHELHTRLTLVCSPLASLLAGDSGGVPGVVSCQIERAHRNAQRLLGIVDDLLDLSRLGAAKREVFREYTDVHEVIEQIVDDAQPLAGSGSLCLDFQCSLGHELMPVDRRMLERTVLELLGSAIELTPPGGAVRLGLTKSAGALELRLDARVGIDPVPARAPVPFADLEPAVARRDGMRLGLVKQLSQLMGGSAELQSAPGRWASVLVRLPILPAAHTLRVAVALSAPVRDGSSLRSSTADTLPCCNVESPSAALSRALWGDRIVEPRGDLGECFAPADTSGRT